MMRLIYLLTFLISFSLLSLLSRTAVFAEDDNFKVIGNLTPTIMFEVGEKIPAPTEELKIGEKVEPPPIELKVLKKIPAPSPSLTIYPVKEYPTLTLTPTNSVPIIISPMVTGPIPITQYPVVTGPISIEVSPAITGPIPLEQNQINGDNAENVQTEVIQDDSQTRQANTNTTGEGGEVGSTGERPIPALVNNVSFLIERLKTILSKLLLF